MQNNEIEAFIIASDTQELRRNFQSVFNYKDPNRRDQCLQELYNMDFPRQGKLKLQSGYILLVQ